MLNRWGMHHGNPYLSLACGLLGMIEEIEPTEQIKGSAYKKGHSLPSHLFDAVKKFKNTKPLQELLGVQFSQAVIAIKEAEFKAYNVVISS